ncbi:piRNA biogenesis protein EXD1-like [Euwallacea fornicatus]|uniref:piRNA biogenesis protein EXD1-like n=1 Tax=Euwallacea fornicatus TaxID=995702 RepID=UPI00338ED191
MAGDYNKIFKIGDRLILELTSSDIFNGIYADGGKDRISLTDVIQHNNNNKLGGVYDFYRNEIANIRKLKPPSAKETVNEDESSTTNSELCTMIKICEEEYFRLKEMSKSYIYIQTADKRYFDAVQVLSDSETIGVVCLGMENHRSSIINLLVMCTWKQVYIFDLTNITKRELYKELKDIFESEYICKVIHKSAGLIDTLYREYNVYVQNTFDTQIVDLMLQKEATGISPMVGRDISECLSHYLNFPKSLLDHALNVSCKSWNERPLTEKFKLYASQIATYLIVLKNHFHKLLLKDVFNTITKVHDCVYDMDNFEFLNYNNNNKEVVKEIQNLIPNLNNLNINEPSKNGTKG